MLSVLLVLVHGIFTSQRVSNALSTGIFSVFSLGKLFNKQGFHYQHLRDIANELMAFHIIDDASVRLKAIIQLSLYDLLWTAAYNPTSTITLIITSNYEDQRGMTIH